MTGGVDQVRFFQGDMVDTILMIARDLRVTADAIEREAGNVVTDHDAALRAVLREYIAGGGNVTIIRLAELAHSVGVARANAARSDGPGAP